MMLSFGYPVVIVARDVEETVSSKTAPQSSQAGTPVRRNNLVTEPRPVDRRYRSHHHFGSCSRYPDEYTTEIYKIADLEAKAMLNCTTLSAHAEAMQNCGSQTAQAAKTLETSQSPWMYRAPGMLRTRQSAVKKLLLPLVQLPYWSSVTN